MRKEGFYWAKFRGVWEPVKCWHHEGFAYFERLGNVWEYFRENEFQEIGSKIEIPS